MTPALKPWTPKLETYIDDDGERMTRPDYWSRPYPASAKMLAAIQAGWDRRVD